MNHQVAKLKIKLQKGDVIKFSKTVHKIGKIDGNKIYLLNENDTLQEKWYKHYQLLKVDFVSKYTPNKEPSEEIHEQTQIIKKFKRKQIKEKLHKVDEEGNFQLHRAIKPLNEKRISKKSFI